MRCARPQAGPHTPASPTPPWPPRQADPRAGRARFALLVPALALLLLGALLQLSAPASAAVLVSNTGQSSEAGSGAYPNAQGFTTGSHAWGYGLDSIGVEVFATTPVTAAGIANLRVQLWSDGNGGPGSKIADLTVPAPASIPGGTRVVTFTAPAGTVLAANTKYYLVFGYVVTQNPRNLSAKWTTSNNEDSGASAGWSIENNGLYQLSNPKLPVSSWTSGWKMKLRVNGAPLPVPSLSLSADRAPREGGGDVTVTARLTSPLPHDVEVAVILDGTATWGGSETRTKFSTTPDYWTPIPAGARKHTWFDKDAGRNDCQAAGLFRIPAGQRSASFPIRVIDDTHPDAGETIVLKASLQRYDRAAGADRGNVTVNYLNRSAALTLAIANDDTGPVTEVKPIVPEIVLRYDANGDGAIDQGEYLQAARDYAAGKIAYGALMPVVDAYRAWKASLRPETAEEQPRERAPAKEEEPETQRRAPLTASFERAPSEHTGSDSFWLNARFSEALGEGGKKPVAASFEVRNGKVKRVRQLEPGLWRVRLAPSSWRDMTVKLAGGRSCGAEGAVCAAGGRALTNTSSATIGGPARIRLAGGKAREGVGATIDFSVTLNRAASGPVTVDYATKDGTATAGEDYTATSGTLTFAVGETEKTVTVALLDDAHDEGKETFKLVLSKPRGAYLRGTHKEAKGTIRNADPMQRAWLGRFGRTAAADAIAAVTARFETPRGAGSHLTLAGQRLSGEGAALAQAVTGLARAFGAEEAADGRVSAPGRSMSAREFLRGTSFRAVLGGGGSRFTGWGSGASVSRFSGAAPELSLSGETATGVMGMDYERGRLLTGLAMTHSLGEGTAEGSGRSYAVGSSVTTMLPYARFEFTDRVSAWSLAGTGKGKLTLELDGAAESHGADLSMTLAAAGVRGEVVRPAAAGGFTLAVKADAYWVRTESDGVSVAGVGNLAEARADASRVRAVLDGSRTFLFGNGGMLTPSMELGVRHDGGHEGAGTGMEVGARLGYADPSRGLDAALRVHGLAARADGDYREWGVSGSLRLVPGASGRGLSMSLTPSWGADPGGPERLWAAPEASGLAARGDAARTGRLDAELGYGMAVLGGRFTGTPNVGFGVSETAREYRMGWRLVSAVHGGFALSLDATRRVETADGGGPAEHGIMFTSVTHW